MLSKVVAIVVVVILGWAVVLFCIFVPLDWQQAIYQAARVGITILLSICLTVCFGFVGATTFDLCTKGGHLQSIAKREGSMMVMEDDTSTATEQS